MQRTLPDLIRYDLVWNSNNSACAPWTCINVWKCERNLEISFTFFLPSRVKYVHIWPVEHFIYRPTFLCFTPAEIQSRHLFRPPRLRHKSLKVF
jgi:hypothetical protein